MVLARVASVAGAAPATITHSRALAKPCLALKPNLTKFGVVVK